jgi:hypothetical protein
MVPYAAKKSLKPFCFALGSSLNCWASQGESEKAIAAPRACQIGYKVFTQNMRGFGFEECRWSANSMSEALPDACPANSRLIQTGISTLGVEIECGRQCVLLFDICLCPSGGMADAEDLKSSGDFSSCGFDSHLGHQSFLLKMNELLGHSVPCTSGVPRFAKERADRGSRPQPNPLPTVPVANVPKARNASL